MRTFFTAIMPMIVLFAIPVLIPIVTVAVGTIADRIRPPRPSAAEEAVAAAQARSAPWRAEMKRVIAAAEAARSQEAVSTEHVPPPPPSPHLAIAAGGGDQTHPGSIAA